VVIYDLTGRKVATLVDKWQAAGNHSVNFDASGLAGGMYFYRIQAGDFLQTRKMLLVK
jgi:hypothetical protein